MGQRQLSVWSAAIAIQCIWRKALVCANGTLDGEIVEENLVRHGRKGGGCGSQKRWRGYLYSGL